MKSLIIAFFQMEEKTILKIEIENLIAVLIKKIHQNLIQHYLKLNHFS